MNDLIEFHRNLLISIYGVPIVAMGIFSRIAGTVEDDEIVTEAHEFCIDAVSDADHVRGVEVLTDENIRDQLTVEQAEEMQSDIQQRKERGKWN